jgi:ribosomal 50S subunit-recycling heat shock protein
MAYDSMIRRTKTPALSTRLIKSGHICRLSGDLIKSEQEVNDEIRRLLDAKVYKMTFNAAVSAVDSFRRRKSNEFYGTNY